MRSEGDGSADERQPYVDHMGRRSVPTIKTSFSCVGPIRYDWFVVFVGSSGLPWDLVLGPWNLLLGPWCLVLGISQFRMKGSADERRPCGDGVLAV